MICLIEKIEEMPAHFPAYPDRVKAWEQSMGAWELKYGSHDGRRTHTAAYFGFIPLGVTSAWVWADVLQKHPNRAMLRAAILTWRNFVMQKPWELWASCKTEREVRFAQAFGFEVAGFSENGTEMRSVGQ